MRKFGLLAAATGLMIGGSVAQANFVVTSVRQQNAFTIGAQSYDIVNFTITDTVAGLTNGQTNQIDLGLYDSTGGGKNGLLISAGGAQAGYPDLFQAFGEASLPHGSWLNGKIGTLLAPAQHNLSGSGVVTFNGTAFTLDQANGSGIFANSYTDLQSVGGLNADETWAAGQVVSGAGQMFAQAVVQHGDSVTLVAPTIDGRVTPSGTWDTGGTAFGINGTGTIIAQSGPSQSANPTGTGVGAYTDAVPEPASIGLLGLAAGGLLARRRRQA